MIDITDKVRKKTLIKSHLREILVSLRIDESGSVQVTFYEEDLIEVVNNMIKDKK